VLRSLTGRGGVLAAAGMLAMTCALLLAPATGAATGIVDKITRAVHHLTLASNRGQTFGGLAAVGALFTTRNGKLDSHYCTASVIHSPFGDLAVTAAHCVTGQPAPLVFVPGYHDGKAPYGNWQITHVYTDAAWNASQDPNDDVAFLRLSNPAAGPVENITGAEQLGGDWTSRAYVRVIGYPDDSERPVQCANWTRSFSPTQLEFDCDGYPVGTSGGPFLTGVNPLTGQGIVIGVIGGYQEGGDTAWVSYSSTFGASVQALYKRAIAPAPGR
jgi:V8-like Glu-specific endopeptidase